jgi:GT2 family glycosyltransferase
MIDVVVVSYRTPHDLEGFCSSYARHHFPGCTLTVVDVDPEVEPNSPWFEQVVDSWIVTHENVGYGKACNMGAAKGTNPVILLANADTLLTADGMHRCFSALMEHDDWGVLGPRQVNRDGQITAGGIFGHPQSPSLRGWNEYDCGQFSDIRDDALSVSGALYFIKRSVWDELTNCEIWQQYSPGIEGAFLPTPHYFEEMTCSVHARGHGYKCVYYGPVQMVHFWHQASPHGGWADQQFSISQHMHREFCALHGLVCE